MELDYDVYAEGEAELGWLNSQMTIEASQPFSLDALLMAVIQRIHSHFVAIEAETAHLKTIGLCDGSYAVANAVSNSTAPELSLASNTMTTQASVVVNARVAIDPAELETLVRREAAAAAAAIGASCEITTLQSFRPGRPVPTHRITEHV